MKQLFAAISVIALLAAAPSWAQTTSTAPTTKAPAAHKQKPAKAKPATSTSGSSAATGDHSHSSKANAATNKKTQELNQQELSRLQ
jgi:hypothetical protein